MQRNFISFLILLTFSCQKPILENTCDYRTDTYLMTLALKLSINDTTNICGLPMNLFTSHSALSLSYNSNLQFKSGQNNSYTPTLTGVPNSISISLGLPSGLTIDSKTGIISGTYLGFSGSKTAYTVTATNNTENSSASTTITVYGRPPTKTLQTQCWDTAGTADGTCTTASSVGQDGAYQKGTSPNFSNPTLVGSDYITTDQTSGLVWNSCNDGFTGAGCATGSYNRPTWAGGNTNCAALNIQNSGVGYASIKTWRLPTPEELESLLNYNASGPATFATNFPNTAPGASTWHWTSLSDPTSSLNAWWVYFSDGQMGPIGVKTDVGQYYVRCVSDGTYTTPNSLLIDNGDGTITDVNKSLVWQKCSVGQSSNDCSNSATTSSWAVALQTCNNLSLNGKTWRLPNINELKTIIDRRTGTNPWIVSSNSLFVSTPVSGIYWSSSTDLGTPAAASAWVTNYNGGTVYTASKATTDKYTRCVSDP